MDNRRDENSSLCRSGILRENGRVATNAVFRAGPDGRAVPGSTVAYRDDLIDAGFDPGFLDAPTGWWEQPVTVPSWDRHDDGDGTLGPRGSDSCDRADAHCGRQATLNCPIAATLRRRCAKLAVGRLDYRSISLLVALPLVTLALTGWSVAALLAVAAGLGLPRMLSGRRAAAARIDRLQALANWTRRLGDVLAAGSGIEQAIESSVGGAPTPISRELPTLVSRIRARQPGDRAPQDPEAGGGGVIGDTVSPWP